MDCCTKYIIYTFLWTKKHKSDNGMENTCCASEPKCYSCDTVGCFFLFTKISKPSQPKALAPITILFPFTNIPHILLPFHVKPKQ